MLIRLLQKNINKQYSKLLLSLILLIILSNLIETKVGSILINVLFFAIILLTINSLVLKSRYWSYLLFFGIISLVADILFLSDILPRSNTNLFLMNSLINISFLWLAIYLLMKKLFQEKKVNGEIIAGGVCVYFLLGIVWALAYWGVYEVDPESFSLPDTPQDLLDFNAIYFSFVTLTTLGYGDMLPVSNLARILSNLEAVTGTLYSSIFIARLVGLYSGKEISNEIDENEKK